MTHYEFCRTNNRTLDDGRMQVYAQRATPEGWVDLTSGQPFKPSGRLEQQFQSGLEALANTLCGSGWSRIQNSNYFARAIETTAGEEQYEFAVATWGFGESVKTGLFGKEKHTYRADASMLTPQQLVYIEERAPLPDLAGAITATETLKSRLLNEGWATADDDLLKRPVESQAEPRNAGPTGNSSVEILKQLAELRDAGVLTEEEFQQKKSQILDSI